MLRYDIYQYPGLARRWKVTEVVVRNTLAENQVT